MPFFIGICRCKGLVAVWVLFLYAIGLHSGFLHPDDVQDAKPQEWSSPDCPK